MNEKEIEELIKESEFPNPAHKSALRDKLFRNTRELDLDELASVAGGVAQQINESWTPWQTPENKPVVLKRASELYNI